MLISRPIGRPGEAEPLMRRMLTIFLRFQRDTGYPHPHRAAARSNYQRLLRELGRSEVEIAAEMQASEGAEGLA